MTTCTRASSRPKSASASVVPSLLPSSTYTISAFSPSCSTTRVNLRCSSFNVASSLKSGTTIDRSTPRGRPVLCGMTKTPCSQHGGRDQILPDQLHVFFDEEVRDRLRAEQLDFLAT